MGGIEVGVQPKEGCAFQRNGCLMGRQDLKAWGTRAVLPDQPALLSSRHAPVARGKMGVSPSVTDSMSFNSKFRRIQRLGVYTIGYKYIECSVLKKYRCVHQFERGDDLSYFATFTTDRHFLEP